MQPEHMPTRRRPPAAPGPEGGGLAGAFYADHLGARLGRAGRAGHRDRGRIPSTVSPASGHRAGRAEEPAQAVCACFHGHGRPSVRGGAFERQRDQPVAAQGMRRGSQPSSRRRWSACWPRWPDSPTRRRWWSMPKPRWAAKYSRRWWSRGRLVRISGEVFFLAATYQEMVQRILDELQTNGKITVGEVRDLFGTSRKYVLALMEHLDERKITRRIGDERVLRTQRGVDAD